MNLSKQSQWHHGMPDNLLGGNDVLYWAENITLLNEADSIMLWLKANEKSQFRPEEIKRITTDVRVASRALVDFYIQWRHIRLEKGKTPLTLKAYSLFNTLLDFLSD